MPGTSDHRLHFVASGTLVGVLSREEAHWAMPHFAVARHKHLILDGVGSHVGESSLFSHSGVLVEAVGVSSRSVELQSIDRSDFWVVLNQLSASEREELLLKLIVTCGRVSLLPCSLVEACARLDDQRRERMRASAEDLSGLFDCAAQILYGVNTHCQSQLEEDLEREGPWTQDQDQDQDQTLDQISEPEWDEDENEDSTSNAEWDEQQDGDSDSYQDDYPSQ